MIAAAHWCAATAVVEREELKMSVMEIVQICIPVITFLMGYFLTNIGYMRSRKLDIVREKFEKLYHPFFLLVNELGTDTEDGFGLAFDTENTSLVKRLIDHLFVNVYLASSEGQRLILETRILLISNMAKGDTVEKENIELFEKSISVLFEHLLLEYMKSAKDLGYDLTGFGVFSGTTGQPGEPVVNEKAVSNK